LGGSVVDRRDDLDETVFLRDLDAQAAGIEPDIKLKPLKVADDDGAEPGAIKESDLTGHLRNDRDDNTDAGQPDSAPEFRIPGPEGDLAQSDYPLYEALNLLKGMTLLQNRKSGLTPTRSPVPQ
jgi:carboxyl-terminal processing protease